MRIPPTEKRGRRQTSTITVAVLPVPSESVIDIPEKDLEWRFTRSSGKGGQNVNKVETVAVAIHKPTGMQVRCANERNQHQNRMLALMLLRAKLQESRDQAVSEKRNDMRSKQIGSGMRGDKIRTIRTQDNIVICERSGKTMPIKNYLKGNLSF